MFAACCNRFGWLVRQPQLRLVQGGAPQLRSNRCACPPSCLQIDTSAMPRLRLVHPPSGRASDASLLSGGALPSPVSSPAAPATPLAPWMPQPFDQAGRAWLGWAGLGWAWPGRVCPTCAGIDVRSVPLLLCARLRTAPVGLPRKPTTTSRDMQARPSRAAASELREMHDPWLCRPAPNSWLRSRWAH